METDRRARKVALFLRAVRTAARRTWRPPAKWSRRTVTGGAVAVAPSGTPDGWRREHATPSGGRTGAERNSRVSRRMFDANANLRPLPVWFRAAVPARRETVWPSRGRSPSWASVLAPSTERLGYQLLHPRRAKLLLISGPTLFRVQAESDAAGIRCAPVA